MGNMREQSMMGSCRHTDPNREGKKERDKFSFHVKEQNFNNKKKMTKKTSTKMINRLTKMSLTAEYSCRLLLSLENI